MASASWYTSLKLQLFLCSTIMTICRHVTGVSNYSSDCQRVCEWPPAPQTCKYRFNVEWFYAMGTACSIGCENSKLPNEVNVSCQQHPDCIILDGFSRPINVVNKQFPGPSIQVCEGDTIIVEVFNDLRMTDEGTSIHWHGMPQRGSPYMDGVPMVTQCPIEYHQQFHYEFSTNSTPGTHWWHSHTGLQRGDGLFGSLIVRQPKRSDPHGDLFDYDLPEHVIILIDWYHKTCFQKLIENELAFDNFDADSILINGKGYRVDGTYKDFSDHEIFTVKKGSRYRFRVIDAGISSCQMVLSVDGHVLKVIATDGQPVEAYDVTSISIDGADRYDFILHADQKRGNYWVKIKGVDGCGLEAFAILHYEGAKKETPLQNNIGYPIPEVVLNECDYTNRDNAIVITSLNYLGTRKTPRDVKETIYIPVTITPNLISTFRGRSFWKPTSPLLYQSQDINSNKFCEDSDPVFCDEEICTCIHTIKVNLGEVIELIFVNVGSVTRCHPIHLHGNEFHVVASEALDHPITMEEIREKDRKGLIHRKLAYAPIKDSVHIPKHGYIIVRVVADNPGWWFLHCHTEWHLANGMAMVFKVGEDDDIPKPPPNFPRCGTWLFPDSSNALNKFGAQASPEASSAHDISGSGSQYKVSASGSGLQFNVSASQGASQGNIWTPLSTTLGVILVITGCITVLIIFHISNTKTMKYKHSDALERAYFLDSK